MASISAVELKGRLSAGTLTLIDIRTKGEVESGMIPGAQWMDVSDPGFMARVATLPKEKKYCLYCASGGRTSMVVPFMEASGFTEVSDLDGGIQAWIAQGGEIVRG
jgi:rhodanese-related sulfurtransferase